MTAVEYIQSLERKVEELEGLLDGDSTRGADDASSPPTPLNNRSERLRRPSLDTPTSSGTSQPSAQVSFAPLPSALGSSITSNANVAQSGQSSPSDSDDDFLVETMVGAGEYDSPHASSFERYRGSFAGLSLLERVQNLCIHASANRKNPNVETVQDEFIHAFDFASPDNESSIPWDAFAMLPSRANFDRAIDIVVDQACCNMQFLGRSARSAFHLIVQGESGTNPNLQIVLRSRALLSRCTLKPRKIQNTTVVSHWPCCMQSWHLPDGSSPPLLAMPLQPQVPEGRSNRRLVPAECY